ncbi:MAG: DUF7507 domain-containing protein [Candidatus Limnocylindrales bacterium]
MHIVKTPSTTSLGVGGGSVTYTYTVTNPGTVSLSDVSVADNKCSSVTGPSAGGDANSNNLLDPGETWVYSCTTTLAATTTNTATATGYYNESPVTDQAQATVTVATPTGCTGICGPVVILTPAMTVTKFVSLSQTGPFNQHSVTTTVGATVWYQVTMSNTGQEALTGVTLGDSLGLATSCPTVPTTLAIGASYSCTYSRVAALGTTTNIATGTSTQTGPKTDTATVIGTAAAQPKPPTGGVAGATGTPHPKPTLPATTEVPGQGGAPNGTILLLLGLLGAGSLALITLTLLRERLLDSVEK